MTNIIQRGLFADKVTIWSATDFCSLVRTNSLERRYSFLKFPRTYKTATGMMSKDSASNGWPSYVNFNRKDKAVKIDPVAKSTMPRNEALTRPR